MMIITVILSSNQEHGFSEGNSQVFLVFLSIFLNFSIYSPVYNPSSIKDNWDHSWVAVVVVIIITFYYYLLLLLLLLSFLSLLLLLLSLGVQSLLHSGIDVGDNIKKYWVPNIFNASL